MIPVFLVLGSLSAKRCSMSLRLPSGRHMDWEGVANNEFIAKNVHFEDVVSEGFEARSANWK